MALEQLNLNSQATDSNWDCDLAIVGGGIVGATLACALKNSGLRVILIESQLPAVAVARQQAYALSL
ncbi:MAG TPA: 2-octaprenyl-6-methoxyphenyl hydroxylase, partial [Cyanobacteria bacterium UBA9273]|nr:2-octaprenyl-6-methoxyphenyl hydroxylase [Cyanobacteria bacterium UBA9273]